MMSSSLFALLLAALLVSSAVAQHQCVSYGYCGKDEDTEKDLPCAVDGQPTPIEKSKVQGVCPALLDSDGKEVPACCDAKQLQVFKDEFKALTKLISYKSNCFLNFQNLVCQAFCSPRQSEFFVVNATARVSEKNVAAEAVYVVDQDYAESLYATCRDARTYVFGIKLPKFMCGKHGSSCSTERFLNFIGSTPAEGGHSPVKIHYVLSKTPVKVGGKDLTPFKSTLF
ncbi:NPC intracellular cholesterol transporter 1-like [Haemaphysalis longicornis]